MRWSLRSQIRLPLIAIQIAAVSAITITTAALAARRNERHIVDRLNGVLDVLEHANCAYTPSVLARMRGLSGAHFVKYSEDGRVTASSLPVATNLPASVRVVPATSHIDLVGSGPAIVVGGTRYFALALQWPGRPRGPRMRAGNRRSRRAKPRSMSGTWSWSSLRSSNPSWSSAATTGWPPPNDSESTAPLSGRSSGSTASVSEISRQFLIHSSTGLHAHRRLS
jgi:hypothetical protein